MSADWRSPLSPRAHALLWYGCALLVWTGGLLLGAQNFPGGFDWQYTVASALASREHNPRGGMWFSGALIVAMGLLWPYASQLKQCLAPSRSSARVAIGAVRLGLVGFALVGIERLFVQDLSDIFYKAHELIALVAFVGMYVGVTVALVQMAWHQRRYIVPLLIIVAPLVAIGVVQLTLYLGQRDLGWVDTSWRERGIPVWLSFAFWQWLALAFLWLGLALPMLACGAKSSRG